MCFKLRSRNNALLRTRWSSTLDFTICGCRQTSAFQPYSLQPIVSTWHTFLFSSFLVSNICPVSTNFYRLLHFSVENSTAGAVIVEASLSCSIFMMRQKILYRKEVCPLRYIKVSTDQQYLRSSGINISSLITFVSDSEFHKYLMEIGHTCMALTLIYFFYYGKSRNEYQNTFSHLQTSNFCQNVIYSSW